MSNPNIAIEEERFEEDIYTKFSKHVEKKGLDKVAFSKPVDLYLTVEELR